MDIFFGIIRWFVGLAVALFVWLVVTLFIPLAVFEQQVLVRENAVKWTTIITKDDDDILSFREGLLSLLVSDRNAKNRINDPVIKAVLAKAVNPTSSVGKAVRNVITPASVRENLQVNLARFFDWYEIDNSKLVFSLKLAGTKADHTEILTAYVKEKYSALPKCRNSAEIKAQLTKEFPECQVVTPEQADYSVMTNQLYKKQEYKDLTTKGLDMPVTVSAKDRQSFRFFRDAATQQLVGAWIIILVGGLVMLALFTPRSIGLVVTGVAIGSAGLMLILLGTTINSASNGAFAALGSPIRTYGWIIAVLGGALPIIAIILPSLNQGKTPSQESSTVGNLSENKVSSGTPVAVTPIKTITTTTKATQITKTEDRKKTEEEKKKKTS